MTKSMNRNFLLAFVALLGVLLALPSLFRWTEISFLPMLFDVIAILLVLLFPFSIVSFMMTKLYAVIKNDTYMGSRIRDISLIMWLIYDEGK